MSLKAPTPDRPAVTRANMGLARAATKIYRRHPAFRRGNDSWDEGGVPSPSQALIAERCAIVREAYEQAARERWAKQLAKEREVEDEAEDAD